MPFAGWSPVGIAAALLIVGGIVLLVVFAVQRGLVHRELEGIDEADGVGDTGETGTVAPAAPAPSRGRSRPLGALGAALLLRGLALGAISATGSWGTDQSTAGPGTAPGDCAQSWQGCPQATPNP
jgi:hypothetical protein